MSEAPLGAPDPFLLRRRVVLTGLLVIPLFFGVSYAIAWLEVSDAWLLVAMALMYLLVIRPMMRPVREAIKLRRRLAYAAGLSEREQQER